MGTGGVTVDGSKPVRLAEVDPDERGAFEDKDAGKAALKVERKRIAAIQERLYAEDGQSLLVILQATDTGGKDGTIRNVFKGVNPQGCVVSSFKVPTEEEASHDAFWRYHRRTPARGMIGIFNRSHYEEVLVVRVKRLAPERVWRSRYDQIVAFEDLLAKNGTKILKFYLHISRVEQRERLRARLDDPEKHWKFAVGDLEERARWDEYQEAFEEAINRTATPVAPWIVMPANRKWYRNWLVAKTVADTLEAMDPQFPAPEADLDGIVIPD